MIAINLLPHPTPNPQSTPTPTSTPTPQVHVVILFLNVWISNTIKWHIKKSFWNCLKVIATGPYWRSVDIAQGNGLVPSGTKIHNLNQIRSHSMATALGYSVSIFSFFMTWYFFPIALVFQFLHLIHQCLIRGAKSKLHESINHIDL